MCGDTSPIRIASLAARDLGCEPQACVVVEDAVIGIEAAIAAGMKAVGVTTYVDAEVLRAADLVVANVRELGLCELESILR